MNIEDKARLGSLKFGIELNFMLLEKNLKIAALSRSNSSKPDRDAGQRANPAYPLSDQLSRSLDPLTPRTSGPSAPPQFRPCGSPYLNVT